MGKAVLFLVFCVALVVVFVRTLDRAEEQAQEYVGSVTKDREYDAVARADSPVWQGFDEERAPLPPTVYPSYPAMMSTASTFYPGRTYGATVSMWR